MLLPLVLVRLLTPEEIGQFKIFFLYVMIFPTFALMTGVTNGLSYWAGRAELGRSLLRTSGRIILATALAFLVVCLALRLPLEAWLKWGSTEVIVFSVALLGAIASTFYEDCAIALGRVWEGAIFAAAWDFARTLAILIVGVATRSVLDIFVAHAFLTLLKTAVAFYRAERGLLRGTRPVEGAISKVLEYGFPVSLAGALGVFVNYSDQMLLSKYLTPADFAFYAVGCLSVPPLTILEYSVTRVLIPQLSESFVESKESRAASLYLRAVDELGFLLIPAVAGMMIFAAPIIQMLFTSRYASATGYLRAYALSYLALIIPYDSVPRARGQARWIFWNFLTFSTLSLGLCFVLIRVYGPFGALFGGLTARLLMRAYGLAYIRGSTGWPFRDFVPASRLARYAGTSLALAPVCLWARGHFHSPILWFLTMGTFFTAAYFLITGLWSRWVFYRSPQSRRILMLTQYIGIGGLERMILNLALTLKKKGGWQPSVYVFDHPSGTEPGSHLGGEFEAARIPITYASKSRGFSLKTALKIAQAIRGGEISVVHTHDLGALIYGVIAKWLTFGRVRLVHTQHSFVHLGRNRRYQLYEKLFTSFADEITVVSPDTLETYLKLGVPESKVRVVMNGVRFPELGTDRRAARLTLAENNAELRALVDSHWILYMARLHGRKGQDHALRIWSALEAGFRRKTALIFVGLETESGQAEKLRVLIEAAPDRPRVQYVGPSLRPDLWLGAAEIFLSASEFEGMPLASIEAAGAGLPLVLSRIPGHQILEPVAKQFSLEQLDQGARALEQTLSEIERDPEAYFREVRRRAEPFRVSYSLERMAETYSDLYPWKR